MKCHKMKKKKNHISLFKINAKIHFLYLFLYQCFKDAYLVVHTRVEFRNICFT